MKKRTNIDVRKRNRNAIYRLIYEKGPLSKQEIVSELKISLPTITKDLEELMEKQLITENDSSKSTGGRKPRVYSCNPRIKLGIGIDITHDFISIVLVDLSGNVIDFVREKENFKDCREYYLLAERLLETIIQRNNIVHQQILGVGIVIPAVITPDNKGIVGTLALEISPAFYENIQPYIKYPCLLFNDANAGGYSEYWKLKHVKNMAYLSLSYSIGGSIMINDEIYYGNNQRSCEFGHLTLVPEGRKCYCGKKGCVDAYCSARVLSESSGVNIETFFDRLHSGDPQFSKIWDEYVYYLSIAINNIRMFFDCDVVIGGEIGRYIDPYIEEIRAMVKNRNLFGTSSDYIKISQMKFETAAVGGALFYINEFIKNI